VTAAGPAGPVAAADVLDSARSILARIADPEIPAISIVDLGIVHDVSLADGTLRVELLPTFIGCPALDVIQATVIELLEPIRTDPAFGVRQVTVTISFAEVWTAERISKDGRVALRASGFAPPEAGRQLVTLAQPATCPYCGSRRTVLENAFGPTRCRSIHYCTACRQPFELFKDG